MECLALDVSMGEFWVVPYLFGSSIFMLRLLIWLEEEILIWLGHPYVVHIKDPSLTSLIISFSPIFAATFTMPTLLPLFLSLAYALSL